MLALSGLLGAYQPHTTVGRGLTGRNDSDLMVLVCPEGDQGGRTETASVEIREHQVELPSLVPARVPTSCGEAWQTSQIITRVTGIQGAALLDVAVYRTENCSADVAELILSMGALTGLAYPFYVPLIHRNEPGHFSGNDVLPLLPQRQVLLKWVDTFNTRYTFAAQRERMAVLGLQSLQARASAIARHLGLLAEGGMLPDFPPACALGDSNSRSSEEGGRLDERQKGGGGDDGGVGVEGTGATDEDLVRREFETVRESAVGRERSRNRKRFVYLATGETEDDFRYACQKELCKQPYLTHDLLIWAHVVGYACQKEPRDPQKRPTEIRKRQLRA